jgi:hypothetical protein
MHLWLIGEEAEQRVLLQNLLYKFGDVPLCHNNDHKRNRNPRIQVSVPNKWQRSSIYNRWRKQSQRPSTRMIAIPCNIPEYHAYQWIMTTRDINLRSRSNCQTIQGAKTVDSRYG